MDENIGKEFKFLTVLSYEGEKGVYGKTPYYKVKCNCGRELIAPLKFLENGVWKSCGECGTRQVKEAETFIGREFGRLKVVGLVTVDTRKGKHSIRMRCVCSCGSGKEVVVTRTSLLNGHTKSCGCWMREVTSINGTKLQDRFLQTRKTWYFLKEGINTRCRSSLEVVYASYLDFNNISFEYEPKTFKLENGKRYTPRFLLNR